MRPKPARPAGFYTHMIENEMTNNCYLNKHKNYYYDHLNC
jgi:hypothetical protein